MLKDILGVFTEYKWGVYNKNLDRNIYICFLMFCVYYIGYVKGGNLIIMLLNFYSKSSFLKRIFNPSIFHTSLICCYIKGQ